MAGRINSRIVAAVIVVIGGALLFASLFVEWYDPGTSGWTAFEVLDLVLAFAAVVALSAGVGALFGERWPEHARFVPVIGLVAFVIVLTQLIGLSYDEAAAVCRCPVGTIRSRVARARADLITALDLAREAGHACFELTLNFAL